MGAAEPPAAKKFCIYYLKKVNFSAFNCIICCINVLCTIQTQNTLTRDILSLTHDIENTALKVCYAP